MNDVPHVAVSGFKLPFNMYRALNFRRNYKNLNWRTVMVEAIQLWMNHYDATLSLKEAERFKKWQDQRIKEASDLEPVAFDL